MKKLIIVFLAISSNCFSLDYTNVPEIEVRRIIVRAEKEWPNNYFMQERYVEREVESYKNVQFIKTHLKD